MSKDTKTTKLFVVNGETSNQIGVVRGAGRHFKNLEVNLISHKKTFVSDSKYVSNEYFFPDWNKRADDFKREFTGFIKQHPGSIIIPTDDSSSLIFSQIKQEVQKYAHVVVSDCDVVSIAVDKKLFQDKMMEMNVPVINSINFKSHDEIVAYLNSGQSVFMKPVDARAEKIYFIVRSLDDYKEFGLDKINVSDYIYQKWIDGHTIYMLYVYIDKKDNLAYCGYDKIRQFPPYAGSGCFVITARKNALIERSVRILKNLGYEGLAELEYKYDPDTNEWYLLEINPRTTTQSRVSNGSAVDVEAFCLKSILENYEGVHQENFQEGLKWMLEIDDILCYKKTRNDNTESYRTRSFKEWMESLKGINSYGIWASDDMWASIVHYSKWINSKIGKYVLRRND